MIKLYVAAPYTLGNPSVNVLRSMEAANKLIDLGFAPYCPLLNHFLHELKPRSYDEWVAQDDEWVKLGNALLRLPGPSKGADREVGLAIQYGLPVFYSIDEVVEFYKPKLIGSYDCEGMRCF